jgi:hypothetical protein
MLDTKLDDFVQLGFFRLLTTACDGKEVKLPCKLLNQRLLNSDLVKASY